MRNAKLIVPAFAVVAVALLIGIFAAVSSGDSHSKAVVKTMKVGGKTILTNRHGMTLYHLSVEKRGHFICTNSSCLSLWKPLVVAKGTTPIGAKSLGTVRRPDGRRQVAYKGGPLYTFVQDRKPGDMKGNGFKDVGVWRAVTVAGTTSSTPASGGSGGYGGYGGY
jgi:predicted lipoprotein with Yx(FWY)xxD motif